MSRRIFFLILIFFNFFFLNFDEIKAYLAGRFLKGEDVGDFFSYHLNDY